MVSMLRNSLNTMPQENANPFAEYLEALAKCCEATLLASYHTLETAKQTEKVADCSLLTVHFVKEVLRDRLDTR